MPETKECPKFKNWEEIGEFKNSFIRMGLATLDLNKPDKETKRIINAFPECFNYEEDKGIISLSIIRRRAVDSYRNQNKHADMSGEERAASLPVAYDAVPSHIPIQGFDKGNARDIAAQSLNLPMLPDELFGNQGDIVEWQGKRFVVLENNDELDEFYIAPIGCVSIDC